MDSNVLAGTGSKLTNIVKGRPHTDVFRYNNANLVKICRIENNTGFACEPRGFSMFRYIFHAFICSLYIILQTKELIMNQANVKVSFYLKKSEADANGNCPVMAKLNFGKYSEAAFSVKMKVPQSRWISGRASGKSVAAKEINNRLDEIRAMALSIYSEQTAVRDGVTAEEVKSILLGMASEQETPRYRVTFPLRERRSG